jgi:hypothetical protein
VAAAKASTLEFVVIGVPVSVNTKNSKNKQAWIAIVKEAARARIPESARLEHADVRATIVWFHGDDDVADTDNIAKCILDGAQGVAFGDDRQIAQVLVRRTRLDGVVLRSPPPMVARAIEGNQDFVYVRVTDEPIDHGELP